MQFKIEPWPHQKEAIERALPLPGFALFFEMGAGKTGTCINILRHKCAAERRWLRTLIFCPPIVIRNWRDEWLKHSNVEPGRICLLTGSGKQRIKKFREQAWDAGGYPNGLIVVTNYEVLSTEPMSELYDELLRWKPEALVLDESHKCKDAKSKRTKRLMNLVEKTQPRFRYLLSGTPVLNSPMDLFAQYKILDDGRTFGKNFFVFRAQYFRDKNAGMPKHKYFPAWEIMPGKMEEINQKLKATSMRVTKEEVMPFLPPIVREPRYVGMTPEQARLYQEMKRDLVTFLKDKAVLATLAITKALRLLQIASGYIKTVDGQEIQIEGTPKQDALRELLEEITPHSKVLVWAVYKQNYAQIRQVCESLGLEYVEVHGEISDGAKARNVARFNTDPKCRVFIGHPESGGIGINLVVASYSIFYSRSFSLEHSEQAEARNHRGGSEIHAKITRIDLITENTIEETVVEKLANKLEIGDKVLGDIVSLLNRESEDLDARPSG